jgi:hypothetical protein
MTTLGYILNTPDFAALTRDRRSQQRFNFQLMSIQFANLARVQRLTAILFGTAISIHAQHSGKKNGQNAHSLSLA